MSADIGLSTPDAPNIETDGSIPVLDYSLLNSPLTKETFLNHLRHALINVGFFYLSNHPVPQPDVDRLIEYIPKLFDLPQESKDKIAMLNSPHFLGYSRFGTELTKGTVDQREQFDFGTRHACRWKDGEPQYYRLWGLSQWPEEHLVPGFKDALERYFDRVQELGYAFSSLIAETLGLGPNGLSQFYDSPELMQDRGKIVRYPVVQGSNDQGVGPHFDGGFLTFLLQASPHRGLQVQNLAGEWVDAPPIPGTFVINFGKALEFVTQGVVRATSHRVLSPRAIGSSNSSPRYSVPLFQSIAPDLRLGDRVLQFPPEIIALRDARGELPATDAANFQDFGRQPSGSVILMGRIKSHPDVGERHYPELFRKCFPNGHSGFNIAY